MSLAPPGASSADFGGEACCFTIVLAGTEHVPFPWGGEEGRSMFITDSLSESVKSCMESWTSYEK